ncbi:hypothetical protein GLE_3648 [Lysobacter enzymogenes]|uniref:Uncharacterized protein n=1 Tax=Lysobacter enzymogenes TaxID=69 RepID=A0A0S2DKC8_LYSEN|nr:hypothetical protein [Lysobacter enzymogenes]ALN58992.1 hypothetical protein GLE_3648 [Lysobacter enzymogenes]
MIAITDAAETFVYKAASPTGRPARRRAKPRRTPHAAQEIGDGA